MWASTRRFRGRARKTWRVTTATVPRLPLEVAEGLVGLGHLVGVLAPLDRGAEVVHGIDELGGELLAHALAAAAACRLDQPAHAEREAAGAADLDPEIGRAAGRG